MGTPYEDYKSSLYDAYTKAAEPIRNEAWNYDIHGAFPQWYKGKQDRVAALFDSLYKKPLAEYEAKQTQQAAVPASSLESGVKSQKDVPPVSIEGTFDEAKALAAKAVAKKAIEDRARDLIDQRRERAQNQLLERREKQTSWGIRGTARNPWGKFRTTENDRQLLADRVGPMPGEIFWMGPGSGSTPPSGYKRPGTYDPNQFFWLAPGFKPTDNLPRTQPGLSQGTSNISIG